MSHQRHSRMIFPPRSVRSFFGGKKRGSLTNGLETFRMNRGAWHSCKRMQASGARTPHPESAMHPVDISIIIVYAVALIGIGIFLSRRAAKSSEHYFLAGRRTPWWALGASGMTSNLDVAGTMTIITMIMRSPVPCAHWWVLPTRCTFTTWRMARSSTPTRSRTSPV